MYESVYAHHSSPYCNIVLSTALPDKFSNCSCKKLFQIHKMFINLELKQSATT